MFTTVYLIMYFLLLNYNHKFTNTHNQIHSLLHIVISICCPYIYFILNHFLIINPINPFYPCNNITIYYLHYSPSQLPSNPLAKYKYILIIIYK